MGMEIEYVTCTCGAKHRIESDDNHFRTKSKQAFEKQHAACQNKSGKKDDTQAAFNLT